MPRQKKRKTKKIIKNEIIKKNKIKKFEKKGFFYSFEENVFIVSRKSFL